uniref:Uncharacterized protein n=2 Tax=Sus scrofa TaxID=9823 RepID=A0A8D0NUF3_PIG
MLNGMASLISLSDHLLLVSRNAINFCELILYPAPLPNSSMSSNSFLVVSLGFSKYSIMSSTNTDRVLLLLFQLRFPLFLFSSLIVIDRTSKTLLNSSGESGHPCLVPYLSGNVFNISPLRMMSAVSLSYMAFIMLR